MFSILLFTSFVLFSVLLSPPYVIFSFLLFTSFVLFSVLLSPPFVMFFILLFTSFSPHVFTSDFSLFFFPPSLLLQLLILPNLSSLSFIFFFVSLAISPFILFLFFIVTFPSSFSLSDLLPFRTHSVLSIPSSHLSLVSHSALSSLLSYNF